MRALVTEKAHVLRGASANIGASGVAELVGNSNRWSNHIAWQSPAGWW